MHRLNTLYHPITAKPFQGNESYVEVPSSPALAPYVRCFWGTPDTRFSPVQQQTLVIPDTCMDVMLRINHSQNRAESLFCGVNDLPFMSTAKPSNDEGFHFCIRFYCWAVPLFADDSMRKVKNLLCDSDAYFSRLKAELLPQLLETATMQERVRVAEAYLLRQLQLDRQNSTVLNVVHQILAHHGRLKTTQLAAYACVSPRQLERLFLEYTGLSPKRLSDLVRYQCLWQEILRNPQFDVQNAVLAYGYHDQAHLLHDFKKYHGMTPVQAKQNANPVAFLQDEKQSLG